MSCSDECDKQCVPNFNGRHSRILSTCKVWKEGRLPCTALISLSEAAVFFSVHFSLPLFTPLFRVILFISTCSIKYIFSEIVYRNNFVIYLCASCIYVLCNKSLLKKSRLVTIIQRETFYGWQIKETAFGLCSVWHSLVPTIIIQWLWLPQKFNSPYAQ